MALLKGTLDVLVLKTLSWGPRHAFEITSWLEQKSGGELDVDDSALIQCLHRMEERGLVAAEWGETDNARRARYYKMTAAGRAHLKAESAGLTAHFATIVAVLGARTAEG